MDSRRGAAALAFLRTRRGRSTVRNSCSAAGRRAARAPQPPAARDSVRPVTERRSAMPLR